MVSVQCKCYPFSLSRSSSKLFEIVTTEVPPASVKTPRSLNSSSLLSSYSTSLKGILSTFSKVPASAPSSFSTTTIPSTRTTITSSMTSATSTTSSSSLNTTVSTTTDVRIVPYSPSLSSVFVKQLSFKTECIDEINVRIRFTRLDLAGTRIIARQSGYNVYQHTNDRQHLQDKTTCGLASWQLGKIDGDNREFQHLVPNHIVILKIENEKEDVSRFPSKILPFLTPIIKITFNISSEVNLLEASSLFVLGLVNVTKETYVGLQYKTGPMDTEFLTFSPQRHIMGWSIPDLRNGVNKFYLHFDTSTNTIMFDFLKLEILPRFQRKTVITIINTAHIRIKGILSSSNSGMTVTTNNSTVGNVEKIVISYRFKGTYKYQAVSSILSSGGICLYHGYKHEYGPSKRVLTDVSKFLFGRTPDSRNDDGHITSLYFNTNSFILNIVYKDGSILIAQLITTKESTQLLVKTLNIFDRNTRSSTMQAITFESTHVNNYLAAVNDVSNGEITVNVLGNLTNFNNHYLYTFRKTSPTKSYLTSTDLELLFPLIWLIITRLCILLRERERGR